jgi:hypothetical protein
MAEVNAAVEQEVKPAVEAESVDEKDVEAKVAAPEADAVEEDETAEPKKPEVVSENQEKAWDRIRRQRNEFKARAEYAERMLQGQQQQPQQQVQQQQATDKPREDQFSTTAEYVDALTDWKLENRLSGLEQKVIATQQQNAVITEWNAKVAAARAEYGDDFDDAAADIATVPITPSTPVINEVLQASPRGADILYYLATNRDEAIRIVNLSPARAVVEIGKIEAYIEAEKKVAKAPVKKVSSAPEPIKAPRAGSGGGHKAADQMSPAEWRIYMNRKEREKLKPR